MNKTQLSGCAIIDNDKLLLLRKKKRQHYEFPGGKVEAGETLEQAAIREVKEEIGCDVTIIKYLHMKEFHFDGKDYQSHKFLAKVYPGQIAQIMEPEAFGEVFYLPIYEYENYSVAPNVKEFCEDYRVGKINISENI